MKKIIITIISFFSLISIANAIDVEQYTYNSDVVLLNNTIPEINTMGVSTADCIHSYDFIDENGNYNNVYISNNEENIFWARYDSKMNRTALYTIPAHFKVSNENYSAAQLFLFKPIGNFIYADGYLYVVYGRIANGSTQEEKLEEPVLALGKYNKSGQKVALKEYKSRQLRHTINASYSVEVPFYGSSQPSLAYNNGVIALFSGHNMVNQHLGSLISFFDANDLTLQTDLFSNHDYGISNELNETQQKTYFVAFHQFSHSFDQRIIATSDGGFLLAEGADARGRGLEVTKIQTVYDSRLNLDVYVPKTYKMFNYTEGGNEPHGNNMLNTTNGGLIELSDGYMYIGATDPILSMNYGSHVNHPWQLVIQKYKKDFGITELPNNEVVDLVYINEDTNGKMQLLSAPVRTPIDVGPGPNFDKGLYLIGNEKDYGMKFLTNLTTEFVLRVRATKAKNDNVVILWEQCSYDPILKNMASRSRTQYYMVIDSNGNTIIPATKIDNATMNNEEAYIYKDNYLYWTSTSGQTVTINKLNVYQEITDINASDVEVEVGETKSIGATNVPKENTSKLTYNINNPNLATIDINGNITGKVVGTTTLTITTSSNITKTINVTVKPKSIPLKSISFEKDKYTIYKGEQTPTKIVLNPSNSNTNEKITYTSSNTYYVKVDDNGVLTGGIRAGTATVTATTSTGLTATVQVTNEIKVTSIYIERLGSININQGEELDLNEYLSFSPSGGMSAATTGFDLEYTTDIPNLIIVTGKNIIKGNKAGKGTLTLTSKLDPSVKRTISITVYAKAGYEPIETKKGDINKNGEIDLTDVLYMLKFHFKSRIPTTEEKTIADMNNDDQINLTDILMLLKVFFNKK